MQTSAPPGAAHRSGAQLWRLARLRFLASVEQAAREKRARLNALREGVLEMVRAGTVVVVEADDAGPVPVTRFVLRCTQPTGTVLILCGFDVYAAVCAARTAVLLGCDDRQGNIEHYTAVAISKRQALRFNRALIESVKQHWVAFSHTKPNGASRRPLAPLRQTLSGGCGV